MTYRAAPEKRNSSGSDQLHSLLIYDINSRLGKNDTEEVYKSYPGKKAFEKVNIPIF